MPFWKKSGSRPIRHNKVSGCEQVVRDGIRVDYNDGDDYRLAAAIADYVRRRPFFMPLFTGVRGRGILRSSQARSSKKFSLEMRSVAA
jgi:hypothetical protein